MFFVTLLISMVIFRIDWENFHSFMNFYWANELGKELILSFWGWVLTIIAFGSLGFAIFIQLQMHQWTLLSYVLSAISGVLLEFFIVGAYTKIVW